MYELVAGQRGLTILCTPMSTGAFVPLTATLGLRGTLALPTSFTSAIALRCCVCVCVCVCVRLLFRVLKSISKSSKPHCLLFTASKTHATIAQQPARGRCWRGFHRQLRLAQHTRERLDHAQRARERNTRCVSQAHVAAHRTQFESTMDVRTSTLNTRAV